MNLNRIKPTALLACALLAVSIPLGTAAQAATTSPAAVSQRPAAVAVGCDYFTANLQDHYYEADKSRNLDWWARGSATSGTPVALGTVSSSSQLDCFKIVGGFGGPVQFQLANSNLCLNIAGNSHSVGAWVILYPCVYHPANELFNSDVSGLADKSFQFQSSSSGLCIDLTNGYNVGSILVQKACKYQDIYQSWYAN